jgi:hypothetical protein
VIVSSRLPAGQNYRSAADLDHSQLPADRYPAYGDNVRVDISRHAADLVLANDGRVWVWAARPRMCCSGAPAWMHAALSQPDGITGFVPVTVAVDQAAQLTVYFRPAGGLRPDVLEIAVQGRHRPRVAAFWDGCLMAMTG